MQTSPGLYGIPQNPNRSEVYIITGSGHGSVNNRIRYFTTLISYSGPAILLVSNSALGTEFRINEDGMYSIHYTDRNETSTYIFGVSVFDGSDISKLTTDIGSIPAANIVMMGEGPSGGLANCLAGTFFFKAGQVVRMHSNGNPNNTSIQSRFRIAKVND